MPRRQPLTSGIWAARRLATGVWAARRLATGIWAALLVAATLSGCGDDAVEPVAVTPPTPSAATAAACARFFAAVPEVVDEGERRETVPDSPLTAAWRVRTDENAAGQKSGDLVVRCGVPKPALRSTSPLRVINDVDWFTADTEVTGPHGYTTVGRTANVELTVPAGRVPAGALVDLADAIKKTLPLVN